MTRPGSRASRERGARLLDTLGRTLVSSGVLLLLFVVYQLWGTGIHEWRNQASLESRLEATTGSFIVPERGAPVSRIVIPSLGVDKVLVGGVDAESLRRGPGLFPGSPLPGQLGNVAIAGHRTTYGAPFENLDKLDVGDKIVFETPRGTKEYRVTREPYNVYPRTVEVIETKDPTKAVLTLITCTPKWTAWKRLIVEAEFVQRDDGATGPETPTPFVDAAPPDSGGDSAGRDVAEPAAFDEGWFNDTSVIPDVIGLAAALVAIALGGRALARRTGRRVLVWTPTALVFLFVLFWFFTALGGLLPSNI